MGGQCRFEQPCRRCLERGFQCDEYEPGRSHPQDDLWDCPVCEREMWVGVGRSPVRHARTAKTRRLVDEYDAALMAAAMGDRIEESR